MDNLCLYYCDNCDVRGLLEPCVLKGTRTVLRGEGHSNALPPTRHDITFCPDRNLVIPVHELSAYLYTPEGA